MILQRHRELIHKCAILSKEAYSDFSSKELAEIVKIDEPSTDTQAYIFRDGNTIYVTGQGTTTIRDWSIDFQIWRTSTKYLDNTRVHAGFVKAYDSVRERVLSEVQKLVTLDCSHIICTGHSLFGAIATIASVDIALKYDIPVSCVTFGSPRVGSKAFTKLFSSVIATSFRCVYKKDPVTFTPLPIRFKHVHGKVLFSNNASTFEAADATCGCIGCRVKHHNMESYELSAAPLTYRFQALALRHKWNTESVQSHEDIAVFLMEQVSNNLKE